MDVSHLGAPIGPMVRVDGGFANRLYRLDSDRGSFAVKELNVVDRRWTYHVEDVFRFEHAAFGAGIRRRSRLAITRSSTAGSRKRSCPKHRYRRRMRSRSVRSSRGSMHWPSARMLGGHPLDAHGRVGQGSPTKSN